MPIRLTGMNSGLDTDRIIQELVRGQRAKVDIIKKNQVSNQWKQDAWKELNTKALKLFNGTLGKMRFTDAYAKKTSKVSSSKATVVTGENAVKGIQELRITNLAKTGYLTGAKLDKSVTSDTKLSQLAGSGLIDADNLSFTVNVGGKEKQINLSGGSTIQNVVSQFRDAGLNANFDANNGRLFISSQTIGEAGDFKITANNENGFKALTAMGINDHDPSQYASLAGIIDGPDGTGPVNAARQSDFDALVAADIASRVAIDRQGLTNVTNNLNEVNDKIAAKAAEYKQYLLDEHSIDADALGWTTDDIFAEMDLIGSGYQGYDYDLAAYNSDMEYIYGVGRAGGGLEDFAASLTTLLNDYDTDPANETHYSSLAETKVRDDINFAKEAMLMSGSAGGDTGMNRIKGEDARIELNGAVFTNNNNTFNINGLTITANQVTEPGETITIATEDDTDGIYNMIKDFIKEYNILINEMDRLYNAPTARDYKPLSEEEKDAMSEREIDEWEKKIKDSILRRDSSLLNISSSMKKAMLDPVTVGGKDMYLNQFGIEALSFFLAPANEKNALFIDGDPDSAHTSNKADKLKEWIANDPSTVTEFFTGLSKNLYDNMNKILMERDSQFKSAMHLYNDKQLKTEHDKMTAAITKQEARLIALEDKYYKQFTAMEVAMAKMQSGQSAISGLLGMQMQR